MFAAMSVVPASATENLSDTDTVVISSAVADAAEDSILTVNSSDGCFKGSQDEENRLRKSDAQ